MKDVFLHTIYRIAGIIAAIILCYVIMLGGKSDPMGLGIIFVLIAITILAPLFLIIEAIKLSKKNKAKEAAANWIIAISLLLVLLNFLTMQ